MAELLDDERAALEDSIMDAHLAAEKYLETSKEVHLKMLEVTVSEALEYLDMFKDVLKEDEKVENYKLHLMVPLQLVRLIQLKQEKLDG